VDKVWEKGFTGKGVVVAVVDHGVSKNHEDLRQNYVSWLTTFKYLYEVTRVILLFSIL
jgi:subtilisin family serine protease